ncbi:hypothetical protein GCM10010381_56430 [Streptomyces xantholiticus]|nr:hypothetical protein GCM10010381_56430 [Streptomyces xantholiticus]
MPLGYEDVAQVVADDRLLHAVRGGQRGDVPVVRDGDVEHAPGHGLDGDVWIHFGQPGVARGVFPGDFGRHAGEQPPGGGGEGADGELPGRAAPALLRGGLGALHAADRLLRGGCRMEGFVG